MAYRSEDEALRARVKELEHELGEARRTIARLQGRVTEPIGRDERRLFGAAMTIEKEAAVPSEVADDAFVAIADALNARIPGGVASQVGNTLTHKKGSYEMRVSRAAGETRVRVRGDYRPARMLFWLGSPGLMLIAAVLLGSAGGLAGPIGAAVGVVLGLATGLLGLRALMKRAIRSDQQLLLGTFEAVVSIANAHAESARARTRIAAGDSREHARDEAAEAEIAAAEEAAAQHAARG